MFEWPVILPCTLRCILLCILPCILLCMDALCSIICLVKWPSQCNLPPPQCLSCCLQNVVVVLKAVLLTLGKPAVLKAAVQNAHTQKIDQFAQRTPAGRWPDGRTVRTLRFTPACKRDSVNFFVYTSFCFELAQRTVAHQKRSGIKSLP